MKRKDGLPKKHGGGRKRTTFCESCKVTPKKVKECRGCLTLHEKKRRIDNRDWHLHVRRIYNHANIEKKREMDRIYREKNIEKILERERARKSRVRYGEFAEVHLEFIKTFRLIKEVLNEESKNSSKI